MQFGVLSIRLFILFPSVEVTEEVPPSLCGCGGYRSVAWVFIVTHKPYHVFFNYYYFDHFLMQVNFQFRIQLARFRLATSSL